MASHDAKKLDFEVGYDLKTHRVSAKLSLPIPPILPRFTPHDVPMRGLLVRIRAGADARNDTPNERQADPSEAEEKILERAKKRSAPDSNFLRVVAERIKNYVEANRPTQELKTDEIVREIDALRTGIETDPVRELQQARRDHQAALEDVQAFKAKHGIRREAKIPETRWQPVALAAVAFLVDGVVNALFLMSASESGLVGGITVAFVLSALNIGMGLAAGYFGLRLIHHADSVLKRVGIALATLFILAGLLFNFGVAHFRDQAEKGIAATQTLSAPIEARPVSIENIDPRVIGHSMLADPFGLSSIMAWLLMVTGLLVFAIGLYEGYRGIDDPYPGYGAVTRTSIRKQKVRTKLNHDLKRDLFWFYQRVKERIQRSIVVHDHFRGEIRAAVNVVKRIFGRAKDDERRVGISARRLVRLYREVNTRVRRRPKVQEKYRPGAPPSWFDDEVRIEQMVPETDVQDALDDAEEALHRIETNIQALKTSFQLINRLQKEMPKHVNDIENEDDERRTEVLVAQPVGGRPAIGR